MLSLSEHSKCGPHGLGALWLKDNGHSHEEPETTHFLLRLRQTYELAWQQFRYWSKLAREEHVG